MNQDIAVYFKINVDAAISDSQATIAVISRDRFGVPIKIWARSIKKSTPLQTETEALLWAVQLAKAEKWSHVICEGDAAPGLYTPPFLIFLL